MTLKQSHHGGHKQVAQLKTYFSHECMTDLIEVKFKFLLFLFQKKGTTLFLTVYSINVFF